MDLCNIATVRKLMEKYGIAAKKGYGQNFLINPSVPADIAEESYSYHMGPSGGKSGSVLEIGPGIGCLTCELAERYERVRAVEIDRGLIPLLGETLADYPNTQVINTDFMKLDLPAFLSEHFPEGKISVCANLPYYITTPILMKLIEEGEGRFDSITIMVQDEVATRLCAAPGDADYGSVTASVHYYGNCRKLFKVAPGNFLPAPKVTSAVIRIELYEEPPYHCVDVETLRRVIAAAFGMRRKTLVNALMASFSDIGKDRIGEILVELGMDIGVRGERLSTEEFCNLANAFYEERKK
ncbi:MAG: ribosomal RNA small subunit methyltransferase A [Clostridia bacterium]|nr:ribosomal RNA small subunit methyltransferase A [Clostridia bacterium]